MIGGFRQALGNAPQRVRRRAFEQPSTRFISLFGDGDADAAERGAMRTARDVQLVNQQHDGVQLAYSTKAAHDFSQPPPDLFDAVGMKLEQGQQPADAASRGPDAV